MFKPPHVRPILAIALALAISTRGAHAEDANDAVRAAAEGSLERAWSQLGPDPGAASPNSRVRIHWSTTRAFVEQTSVDGAAAPSLRVDPRLAEELERLIVATAVADRLRVRDALRTYALDRALAHVGAGAPTSTTFWDVLGWTGPGRSLLTGQPAFGELVDAMRDQAYRWLVARALAAADRPATAEERVEATGRRLLAVGEWPLFPLAAAVLVVALEDTRGAAGRDRWLCGAAAINYTGARLIRRDTVVREDMDRDRVMRARLAAWLAELELLNAQYERALHW